jgi:hypothetical protein
VVLALRIAQRSADLARDLAGLLTLEAPDLDGEVKLELADLTRQITGDVVRKVLAPGLSSD